MPRGIQRGVIHRLKFVGDRLDDVEDVFFYDDGFDVVDVKVINSKKVVVKVRVDPDCRLGEHMVQLRARSGISDYRILQVEAYPSVDESEPTNDVRQTAQLVRPVIYSDEFPDGVGVVVAGRMEDEDQDWFAVDGVKGDRLSIEVLGTRLGDFCDTQLELFGPQGDSLVMVDDTALTKQDPFVCLQLPEDGRLPDSLDRRCGAWRKRCVVSLARWEFSSSINGSFRRLRRLARARRSFFKETRLGQLNRFSLPKSVICTRVRFR